MMTPPVTVIVMTTIVVPAIVRPDNDAGRLGRHAGGGNTADCDHRSDQYALHYRSPCSMPEKRETPLVVPAKSAPFAAPPA
jgi:hypothetical protein